MSDTVSVNQPGWLRRFVLVWAGAASATLGVMLTHQSDDPILLGRYSGLVTLLLGALLVACCAAWAAVWLLRDEGRQSGWEKRLASWRSRRGFRPLIVTMSGTALFIFWHIFLGDHVFTYAFLRGFIGFSMVVGALALTYGGDPAAGNTRRWDYGLWVAMALVLALALLTTPFYPDLLKTDEVFVFSMARNALENGHFRPMIYAHAFPEYYFGGVWIWIMAGWLKITGLSLSAGRLYVLFLSCLSTLLIGWAGARLYNRATAYFAMILALYSFVALNHIRYDIHAAVWLSAGVFFFSLTQTTGRWWTYFLTGFAVGMMIDSNPITYCFGLGVGLFYAAYYIRHIVTERLWFYHPFWLLLAGGATALGLYLVIHRGASFTGNQTTGDMLIVYLDSIQSGLASGRFLDLAGRYFSTFVMGQPVLFALLLVGVATTIRERAPADGLLLALLLAWIGVIIFTYFYFPVFYLVMGLPVVALLAARGVERGIPLLLNSAPGALTATACLLVVVWLLASLTRNIRGAWQTSLADVVETGREIGQIVPSDAVVVAAEPYYFGMIEHRRFVGGAIESFLTNYRDLTPVEAWTTVAPDALVFSEYWPTEPERTPALVSYMEDHAFTLLACYQTVSFGRVELWVREVPAGLTPSDICTPVCNPRAGCS